jgi:hypothetical protein
VDPTPEDDAELPGVDTDFDAKPTGVEVDSDYVPQELTEVDGLGQQDTSTAPTERSSVEPSTTPAVETHAPSPKKGCRHGMPGIGRSNLKNTFPA